MDIITKLYYLSTAKKAYIIGLICCLSIFLIPRYTKPYPIYDTYPLYFGAKAFIQEGNAYTLDNVTQGINLNKYINFNIQEVGNGYPFPAVFLYIPLSGIPTPYMSIIWLAIIIGLLTYALYLFRIPIWWLAFYPIVVGFDFEQYTMFILSFQIIAVCMWKYYKNHPSSAWIIIICTAIMLTKPNQSIFIVLYFLWQYRKEYKKIGIVYSIIWGIPSIIYPMWIFHWIDSISNYNTAAGFIVPWMMTLYVLPLIYKKYWLEAIIILQLALFQHPLIYPSVILCLLVLRHKYSFLSVISGFLWLPLYYNVIPLFNFSYENRPLFDLIIINATIVPVTLLILLSMPQPKPPQIALQ